MADETELQANANKRGRDPLTKKADCGKPSPSCHAPSNPIERMFFPWFGFDGYPPFRYPSYGYPSYGYPPFGYPPFGYPPNRYPR